MTDPAELHSSPLRSLMAEATGVPYHSFASLHDAKADVDGTVILEGDDGGQIYVVAPARVVACAEAVLDRLLRDLDAISWPDNGADSARLVFEMCAVGSTLSGGKGGAVVTNGVWVHPELTQLGIEGEIRAVLAGQQERLSDDSRAKRR